MLCLFINLGHATERRSRLERDFASVAPPAWRLQRIEAAGPLDVSDIPGGLTPGEKGCFLSHARALNAALEHPGDVMILEDDASFSAESFRLIEQLRANTQGWDVLWTDPSLMSGRDFVLCAAEYGQRRASGQFRVTDLRGVEFTGSTAYVVREPAKRTLLECLDTGRVERPYDLHLRDLINAGEIRGAYVFPFVTTLADLADDSTIIGQAPLHESARNLYRRLMFMERDLGKCRAMAQELSRRAQDDHAQACGAILAALLAPQRP